MLNTLKHYKVREGMDTKHDMKRKQNCASVWKSACLALSCLFGGLRVVALWAVCMFDRGCCSDELYWNRNTPMKTNHSPTQNKGRGAVFNSHPVTFSIIVVVSTYRRGTCIQEFSKRGVVMLNSRIGRKSQNEVRTGTWKQNISSNILNSSRLIRRGKKG